MRTTLNLPDDLLKIASTISRSRGTSVSKIVAELARRGLNSSAASSAFTEKNGFAMVPRLDGQETFGQEDVASALDKQEIDRADCDS